jgi:hypothetical protein
MRSGWTDRGRERALRTFAGGGPPMDAKTQAVLVTVAFSVVGVLGDHAE